MFRDLRGPVGFCQACKKRGQKRLLVVLRSGVAACPYCDAPMPPTVPT